LAAVQSKQQQLQAILPNKLRALVY